VKTATVLLALLALAACTPPAPKQNDAPTPEPGLSVSGYATVGVVKTF
jgi:hypothetical protein